MIRLLKKIVLTISILVFLLLTAVFGTGIYFYHHPSHVKTLLEKSLSRASGTPCAIKALSYGLNPLTLELEGIVLTPNQGQKGMRLEIPAIRADMSLEGSFGNKVLVVNRTYIEGLFLHINREWDLPPIPQKDGGSSLLGRAIRALTSFFLFREIRVEEISLSKGEVIALSDAARIRIDDIHAGLDSDRLLTLTCGLHAVWPSREMRLEVPDLRITTDQALSMTNPVIKGKIATQKSSFIGAQGEIKRAGLKTAFFYRIEDSTLDLESMDLDLDGLLLIFQSERISFPGVMRIRTEGSLDLRDRSLELPLLSILSEGVLKLTSSLAAGLGPRQEMELDVLDGTLHPAPLLSILPNRIKEKLTPIDLAGPISFRGKLFGGLVGDSWDLTVDMESEFRDNPYRYTSSPLIISGVLSGPLTVQGRFPNVRLSAEVTSNETTLTGTDIPHDPSRISVSLFGEYPSFTIKDLSVHCPSLDLPLRERTVPVKDIQVVISKGLLDLEGNSIILPEISLDSSLIGNLKMSLEAKKDSFIISLQGRETRLIKTGLATGIVPPGWKITGEDAWQLLLRQEGENPWKFVLHMGLENVAFQGPEDIFLGEGIVINHTLEGEYHREDMRLFSETSLKVIGGEILLDRFYFDLNKNPFSISGTGQYGMSDQSLEFPEITIDITDILKTTLRGKVASADASINAQVNVRIPDARLKPIFDQFLLEPFREELPLLKGMDLGGTISGDMDLEVSGLDRSVIANLRWRDGELLSPDADVSLNGINLDLPLWYLPRSPTTPDSLKSGMLSIKEMRLPVLSPQSLSLPLEAGPNRLDTLSSLVLEIPGGHISLGPLTIRDLFSPERSADTKIEIDIKDIRPLFVGLFPRDLRGTIKGSLEEVNFINNSLTTVGEIDARIFDGEVILSDVAAFGLLTPAPFIRLSARWNDLSLSELTVDTEFGKIEGLLYGRVKDLELAHGQPRKFDLWLETLKRKGVSQRISVKAVDNIARIGGGQSPFMGMAGGILTSFFKEFPYRKIGIHTFLENDVFRVNGTIKEGGKEYLIKRSGFSGVDVVNQNPDNRISFKDMVKRIKRVTSPKGGPVIK